MQNIFQTPVDLFVINRMRFPALKIACVLLFLTETLLRAAEPSTEQTAG